MSFVRSLINGGGSNITTPDLLKDTSKPITDTDYFDIVITDLQPNTSYNVQFSWVYPDDTRSEYSSTYNFTTSLESAPAIPSQPTVTVGPGLINVTWNGNKAGGGALQNYAKVNIYVNGVLRDFLLASGTKSIPLAKGTYSITLRSASSTNVVSDATSPAVSATVTADATDATAAQSSANQALLELQNKLTKTANMLIVSDNLTAINSNGITLFTTGVENGSATSVPSIGKRVVMNYKGIRAYDSSSTNDLTGVTFAIDATNGNAYFKGEIGASRITAALTMDAGNSLRVGPSASSANTSNIILRSTSTALAELVFNTVNASSISTSHSIYSSEFALSIYPNGASTGAMSFFGSNAAIPNRIVVRNEMRYLGDYSSFGGNSSAMNSNLSPFFRNILFGLSDPPTAVATDYAPGTIYLAYTA